MKQALVSGHLVTAAPDVIVKGNATCPGCGHPVDLRRRGDTYFWRHQAGAPRDCPVRRGDWQPPAEGNPPPSPEQIAELIALARRVGAKVVTLEGGQTVEVTGPGTVILTARKSQ
jgi:hypothetical protein